jgi:hypothetical protein
MAIRNNIEQGASGFGVAFDGAYYRIVTASISRQRGTDPKFSVMIDLSAYATNPLKNDDTREVDFKRFTPPLSDVEAVTGDTFLGQCYNWVMAQSEMSGSETA